MSCTTPIERRLAHLAIRTYQLTLSSTVGTRCRHLPTCSSYMDEAIQRHGIWAGGFMGLARLCRCHPWGTAGFDPVPESLPSRARWWRPWTYGRWRGPLPVAWGADIDPISAPDGNAATTGRPRKHSTR
jgi:putative membrane protein insertion efficiency factor